MDCIRNHCEFLGLVDFSFEYCMYCGLLEAHDFEFMEIKLPLYDLVVVNWKLRMQFSPVLTWFISQNVTEWGRLLVNIGSGNGLVLSGNKPLPEPMLAKFYDAI